MLVENRICKHVFYSIEYKNCMKVSTPKRQNVPVVATEFYTYNDVFEHDKFQILK